MYNQVGKIYGAYTLEERHELANLNGVGYVLRHNQTKARVAVIANDDNNKVFNIAFRTPPKDDTGVPHIMEHSVLCGSEKFPVKDPFVELVKGSLNTFLNAMTYPDKTVYPVASCNDKDFQNLMDVYLDAVFHPNIYHHKEIMMQEGWHYECESADAPIQYNGVVYNEMKGVFSSAEGRMERLSMRGLYPDTTYFYESGGAPEAIPDLTYEQFLEFHRTYYHPSNSYIYLYGDMDVEEKLDFIDREYLSKYEYLEVDSRIPKQQAFDRCREITETYAITDAEDEKDKTYLSYNVVVGSNGDANQYLALQILNYVLLSVPGAPLKKALIDSGIGKDVTGGYETSLNQPMFSVSVTNANAEQKDDFVRVLRDTLAQIVADGLPKKMLKAAVNVYEFQYREANYGSYPKGLMLGLKMFDSWLYDDGNVFTYVDMEDAIAFVKEQVNTDYFEQLIQTYFLDNTHASLVVMAPERGLAAKEDAAVANRLAAYKEQLNEAQLQELVHNTVVLKEYQDSEDSEEALRKIPLLKLSDIEPNVEPFVNQEMQIADTKVVVHDLFTNGITYLNLSFDMRNLPLELVPVSSVLVSLMKQVDTEHYTYQEFASEVNLHAGGIAVSTNTCKSVKHPDDFQARFEIRAKALHSEVDKTMELIQEMLLTSKITDEKRILEILEEDKANQRAMLISSGHSAMVNRAMSYFDSQAKYKSMTDMLDYYDFLVDVTEHFEERKELLKEQLVKTAKLIFTGNHLIVSVTTNEAVAPLLEQPLKRFKQALYPDYTQAAPKLALRFETEGYETSSKVQYVACAGRFAPEDYTGALIVLCKIFSYEYLWMNVRVKGGAYGCSSFYSNLGTGYFTSYRDPNLKGTYDVYDGAVDFVKNFDVDERTMTKYIIGAISGLDAPLTPSAKGDRSFLAYLTETTDAMKQRERDEVLATNVDAIRALAPIVEAVLKTGARACLGSEEEVRSCADLFDKLVKLK